MMHFDGEIQFRVWSKRPRDLCFRHAVQAATAGMDVETRLVEMHDARCDVCVTDLLASRPPRPESPVSECQTSALP
jgi:hypothetical protein